MRLNCCFLLFFVILVGACRSGGKDSSSPPGPECQTTEEKDPAAALKEELLKQGQWVKDGDRWKATNAGSMIFKSIALVQEKPELLKNAGKDAEEKWSAFYADAMQFKDQELTLADTNDNAKSNCP